MEMMRTRIKMNYLFILLFISVLCVVIQLHECSNKFKVKRQQQSNATAYNKLRPHEVWAEVNDTIVLNCSLKISKDHHVIWHRKYDNMGVHVLTILSETFISDLRIRPIKHEFSSSSSSSNKHHSSLLADSLSANATSSSSSSSSVMSLPSEKYFTYNLEIRRLKRDDSALYYCVLNSENIYGQFYKLEVLPQLKMLNKSEVRVDKLQQLQQQLQKNVKHHSTSYFKNDLAPAGAADDLAKIKNDQWSIKDEQMQPPLHEEEPADTIKLICRYDDLLIFRQQENSDDDNNVDNHQIKWYFNRHLIKPIVSTNNNQTTIIAKMIDPSIKNHFNNNLINNNNNKNNQNNNHNNNDFEQLMTHFRIVQTTSTDSTNTTTSILYIRNFSMKHHLGKYKCQYKGLSKTVRLIAAATANSNASSIMNGGKTSKTFLNNMNSNKTSKSKQVSNQIVKSNKHQPSKYSTILDNHHHHQHQQLSHQENEDEEDDVLDEDKYVMESVVSLNKATAAVAAVPSRRSSSFILITLLFQNLFLPTIFTSFILFN